MKSLMERRSMKMRSEMLPVLVVEDHPVVAMAMQIHLAKIDERLTVTVAASAQSAIDTFKRNSNWFRVFLDLNIPGARGFSLVWEFHGNAPANPAPGEVEFSR